ncbi:tRNA (N6-threonylcarbamoyladenosine(37)-N6)-methyltransferase TrmO [Mariprofundus erugo]|uniref:tRNA (N6-threonylcarbamoyladenosine(37)-N6)-methyltransferase TrmO n=1 Tax=Mariprofundus erugo TaxID=2528639 RepID=A0A5R9GRK8_9PROT|nr:tRNA (N6-threonylcarbamoyladenosine(37)-N6)-methyltransferase TrmO [Mariprofundus erugo]TLS67559.1 tRNA (N6-threonylcarbamoyladenosine(37)-N6)-methyltransferase TrmO [Mariprofundus erugo]TLS76223.1 tRNA (N6-threonylcarbamoyladenosine(37)-N6)-methyltransferase TrmO [Mariprofundus erugo]
MSHSHQRRTRIKPPKQYTDEFNHTESAAMHISMAAIGVVKSSYRERFATPRQPSLDQPEQAEIHLNPGLNFEQALADLNGFSHIWVIYWMHLNNGWNPTVMPPRGPKQRRGLFATRAPHRPNSLGLSAVRLTGIKGRVLFIEGHDMLDGTPVLDIKPYIPYADMIEDASSGWLAEVGLVGPDGKAISDG